MRAGDGLRPPRKGTILFDMEVFSTVPRAVLPWTANILTVAVLLSATWWSAAKRPPAALPAVYAVASAGPAQQLSNKQASNRAAPVQESAAAPTPGTAPPTTSAWPAWSQVRDGLQQVVYQPGTKPR
jgi:hypothetical protein